MHVIGPSVERKIRIGDIGLVDPVHILDFPQRGERAVGIEVDHPVTQGHVPVQQIIETDRQVIGTPQINDRQRLIIRIGRFYQDRTESGRCLSLHIRQQAR